MLRKLLKPTQINNYNLFKYTTPIKLFATGQEPVAIDASPADMRNNKWVHEVLGKYKEQDVEKMLHIINNFSPMDLLGYNISKNRANKLVAYRMRNGLFKGLTDIFFIDSFGIKVADKFLQSLLEEPKPVHNVEKRLQGKAASFITPFMELEQMTNINTCTAVRIGVNSITWSKFELSSKECNDPCRLTNWEHHEISEKKLHFSDLIQRCQYINHQIPNADCYIFETPQLAQVTNKPGSVEQQNINITKAQVTAMMAYALAARSSYNHDSLNEDEEIDNPPPCRPSVFYVKRLLTARLFKHLVGTERISTEQTVFDLMRTNYNTEDMEDFDLATDGSIEQIEFGKARQEYVFDMRGNVEFPMELRQMFSKAPRYYREFLGQALLLNLTFVRLVLLQDRKSIDQVTRGGKNKKDTNDEYVKEEIKNI